MRAAVRSLGNAVFASPYSLLPHIVFVFTVLCFIIHPNGAIRTGYLADTDDYMRLNETINWLQGAGGWQGWFDVSHPRLSPGSNTIVHWSRLLDVPLALIMLPFIKTIGMQNAALLASLIVPPVTFGTLIWLVTVLAKPFVGDNRANLAPLMVLFAPMVLMNFVPGRVDHHGYEILVAGFGVFSLQRIIGNAQTAIRYCTYAAIIFACGLWIGTEALPWIVLFIACLGVTAAWQGRELLRHAVIFGLAFTISTVVILVLAVAPNEYSSLALSWYSSADVIFAALSASALACSWLTCKKIASPWVRLLLTSLFGMTAGFAFCLIVPDVMKGPFADYDNFDATVALDSIGEAQPLIQSLHFNFYNHTQVIAALLSFLQILALPILGLLASIFLWRRSTTEKRLQLFSPIVFLAVSIPLTVFWQMRIGWFMQFFAIAPLTYVLVTCWDKIARHFQGRTRFWMEILTFLSLGFFPVILLPSLAHDAPVYSDVALFPAARPPQTCPLRPTADFLDQSWGYGASTHTILASANEGPELLFRTNHNVIAANFNVAGNEDVYEFFGARDDVVAKNILDKWHADLVLICKSFPLAYAHLQHAHLGRTAFLSPASDGKLHIVSNPEHLTLVERLVRGPVPDWLKPVEIPMDKDYLLFEVRH